MPIRWRLTIFIALVIGVILLLLGVALFFLNRNATMSGIEDTVRTRATAAALTIDSGEDLIPFRAIDVITPPRPPPTKNIR